MMQVTRLKCITLTFITLNLLSIYILWRYINSTNDNYQPQGNPHHAGSLTQNLNYIHNNIVNGNVSIVEAITVVLYDFEDFDNDVTDTISSFLKVYPSIQIIIVIERVLYPPIRLPNISNIHVVITHSLLSNNVQLRDPMKYIKTRYVLLIPDSTRLEAKHQLKQMLISLEKSVQVVSMVSARFTGSTTLCNQIKLNLKEWTLTYSEKGDFRRCDALEEKQVILIRKQHLEEFLHPFARPFPEALYIQAAALKRKVRLLRNVVLQNGRTLFEDPHKRWKYDQLKPQNLDMSYRRFGIKKVVFSNGEAEYHGCKRDTPRCFPTVVDDMPDYLFMGRWTPPCCLEALRKTARHVFKVLEDSGVRYWLEGGSLLGAARNGDIIPWDYDVDIGIYRDDVYKCSWLQAANKETVTDDVGYVWEKAREGDFYRVQYSHINRLHVDIFPFYSSEGVMTKDTWFPSHKQDVEFPESFLNPFSTIEFAGVDASSPNNIREFLELKFGEGVIENPQYPDPHAIGIPQKQNIQD